MTLIPEQGGLIFVEAKRFGVIQELALARARLQGVVTPGQMALPGWVSRTMSSGVRLTRNTRRT